VNADKRPASKRSVRAAAKPAIPASAMLTQSYWEATFAQEDPWGYASSDYERWKYEQTLSLLPPGPIGRALELGCAEGHFSERLARRVRRLISVDISETALRRARARCRKLPGVDFRALNLATDALPGGFDVVVCSEVLFYLPPEVLREVAPKIAACLKRGGHLLLAHGNLVSDDRARTGFDWGHPFGAKTIGEVFGAVEGLQLVRELRTPLFTVQLFCNLPAAAAGAPERAELPLPFDLELTPAMERTIIWDGAVTLRSEAARDELTAEVPILMYHSIADDGPPELAPYRVSPRAFREQLRYLRRHGFHSITLHEWADALAANRMLPGRPVIITLDDGYYDFLENGFPALQRADFSATVFVVTDKVGGAADWDTVSTRPMQLMGWPDIQLLRANGIDFGSHSTAHRDLRTLARDEVVADGTRSRQTLVGKIGGDVDIFSFPWGCSDNAIRQALGNCGYRIAVSTERRASRLGDDPMNLPRIEVLGSDTVADLARKLERQPAPGAGTAAPVGTADRSGFGPPAAVPPQGPDMPIHPDYVRILSHQLDTLVGEFVALQSRLLRTLRAPGSLQARLVGLFSQPLTGSTVRIASPGTEIAPGIVVNFDEGAGVTLTVRPKANHALSPDTYLNTVGLQLTGVSEWFALEIDLDWADLSLACRFQLSLYARTSRPVNGTAVLRLPTRNGGVLETTFAAFVLDVHDSNAIASGDLEVPDFVGLDTGRRPQVLVSFDCSSDLELTIHYINLYFA
jgi:peptidoglycan/xylan/chitin deacetylase (PgdA/CDA1 family)